MSEVLQRKETNLGEDKVGSLLIKLAVPAITAQIINVLYNMVDRMYIGHIADVGASALTGVGVTMPIILLISAFASLIGSGGAPRTSIMMGKNDYQRAEKILGNCFSALTILALTLTVVFLIFNRDILFLFGASESTIDYALDYMNIYALGTIFVLYALGLNMFISSQGFAKISMLTVIIGAVSNIILDPIFIFGFQMGVKGAALATIISQGISAIWVIYFLLSKKSKLRIKRQNLIIDYKVLLPVLALGISPFIMQATESVINVCFNTSLLKYGGDLAVGAMTILSSIMQFAMLPLVGLTQGAQPIISFNYGARNSERVKKAFTLLLISAMTYSTIVWGATMIVPQIFAHIFSNVTELVELSKWTMRIYMGASLLLGAQVACQQTFIALGNAKVSLFLALLRKVFLLIPLIYILPSITTTFLSNFFTKPQVAAVFLAEPVADVIAVTTTVIMFRIHFKRIMKKIED